MSTKTTLADGDTFHRVPPRDPMLNVVAWGEIGAANGGTEFANKITLLTVLR